jgi:hypothetical protein
MRYNILAVFLVITAVCGCASSPPVSTPPAADESARFMTGFGTFAPAGSPWTIIVDAQGTLQISHRNAFGSTGVSEPNWRAKPGWFGFVENDQRAWVYDGDKNLLLLVAEGESRTSSYGPYAFPYPVPNEVFARLSSAARKAIKTH